MERSRTEGMLTEMGTTEPSRSREEAGVAHASWFSRDISRGCKGGECKRDIEEWPVAFAVFEGRASRSWGSGKREREREKERRRGRRGRGRERQR